MGNLWFIVNLTELEIELAENLYWQIVVCRNEC